jgi:1-deoxy-D-xylulose-5-phosphate reductoisomerase
MGNNVKRLAILGSTGSIGQQTLDVVRFFPDLFRVVGLGAGSNIDLLVEQVEEFQPKLVSIESASSAEILHGSMRQILPSHELVAHPDVDLVVIAISGKAGLDPTLAAIRARKRIALATKEVLVLAGGTITSKAKQHGARILPIDSEPSAIWQCMRGEPLTLTQQVVQSFGGRSCYAERIELSQFPQKLSSIYA